MSDRNAGPPAPQLARVRSRWLSAATVSLRADPGVLGVALAGSLGAGCADDWSDVDLLVVVDDAALDAHAAPGRVAGVPGTLAFASDARHSAPRGARLSSEPSPRPAVRGHVGPTAPQGPCDTEPSLGERPGSPVQKPISL